MNTTIRTIQSTSEEIQRGKLKPTDLLEELLDRLVRIEPMIKAWVLVDYDRCRTDARRSEVEIAKGKYRGPLHGIPLGIKDIVDVFDWPTAAGSRRWANSIARQDAEVVKSLRQAGAVLVGKTVTTQYASFDPPPTRNPWNLERTPGGSSSGSAAAVATGTCLGALASQTGGSITRPAAYCGVACFKPTFGRVSTVGVVPLAYSMDHIGAMAQTVGDLWILFKAMASPGFSSTKNETMQLVQQGKGPKIGRLHGLFDDQAEPAIREMMDRCQNKLMKAGATIVDVISPPAFAEINSNHSTIMAVEAAQFHGERLRRHPEDYDPNIRQLLEIGLSCPGPEYARCKQVQSDLGDQIRFFFQGIDALLTPAAPGPAPTLETTGKPTFNSPWSYLGLPTIGLPAELTSDRLPLGIQLIGPRGGDENLFQVATWCEAQLDWKNQYPGF